MIKLQNIDKSFGTQKALSQLSIDIKSGEIYGLLGPNGAGKTTTLNLLLGFLQADNGQITVADLDVASQTQKARNAIAYISENVMLYPYLTGIENLDYFCQLAGLNFSKQELADFLTSCGLDLPQHHKRLDAYSKGMRQKVGIAIAVAKKAKVYLLDEPASGLDPFASNELTVLLKKLASDGATILMASHDIFRVKETCNRIGILSQGKLIKELVASAISANELEKVYLENINN